MGKDGSRAYYKDLRVEAAPFLQENTIETTGAGDTFCASALNYVLEHGLEDLTAENLKRASDLCQRSRFSDHHQKRRASRYAVQRRSSGIYRIQTVIFPWNRL